jgi:ubiquinone/menaquinone biosynthesis C-methylase UbiE
VNPGWEGGDAALQTYQALAPSYDDFTLGFGYKYENWTATLLAKAEEEGLRGNRLLDVACGTGFSFIPLLDRGWQVTGCDVSAAMIEGARAKVGDRAELVVADMRELPVLGEFDLIWAINTPLAYLLSGEELKATLAGMRRNLAPGGLALFDAMTMKTARTFFSERFEVEREGKRFTWTGKLAAAEVKPGAVGGGRLEEGGEAQLTHDHAMRHFDEGEHRTAIEAAGLRCDRVFGEKDGQLQPDLDEEDHAVAVYFCRLPG